MRKKCVLWAKPVLATLIIIAVSLQWSDSTLSAQSTPNPLTLPRLAFSDFIYQGGFRMPATPQDAFSYGGRQLAFNPARNSLFVGSLSGKVAEVTIPAPAITSNRLQMPFASYLQPFSDPAEGHMSDIGSGVVLGGMLVQGDRLYSTGYVYYDGGYTQRLSHFSHSTNLSEPSFSGMSQVWDTGKAGFVGGYLASVPSEWQSLLGGPALTGQCCIPIVTRTSYGPAAFGFNPAGIGGNTAVPASPLLYYTADHTTLGPWEGSSEFYGAATIMGGAAVIAGTRTALFVGRIGAGTYCYGYGVSDPALAGTRGEDGVTSNCYDPANSGKGTHGYPYRYQIWAYDLADFAAVKAGAKQPWDVVPYAVWPFELPTPEQTMEIGGVAYDAQRQLLYVSQMFADVDQYDRRPIIHTLKINAPSTTLPPPSTTAVSTAPSQPVASVALTTNVPAPKPAGSTIVWTATPTGGTGQLLYKWFVNDGTWKPVGAWTSSNQFSWTPTVANDGYRVAVGVKRETNTADVSEATSEQVFSISAATVAPAPVVSVALTTNVPAPRPAGSTIVWTATTTGGAGPQLYKWFVNDGTWKPIGTWSTSNQFSWTPTAANDGYRIAVGVKRASITADVSEVSSEQVFSITEAAPVSAPVVSVAMKANLSAPRAPGTTIVWTATPTGGAGAQLYKWFVNDGTWKPVGSWTSSNQFAWTPTVANEGYRIAVGVKRASNTADVSEVSSEQMFPIIGALSVPVASVTLATSLPAPQEVASTIVWTATPTGGTGALVYKWFVTKDGATNAVATWTSSNQFTWTPTVASANYQVVVWVKRASNPADAAEAFAQRAFAVEEPLTGVALAMNLASPQLLSSTIEWTATPSGGTGTLLYKWFVSSNDGVTWTAAGPWAASNRVNWTPTEVHPKYRVTVWVKHATNPSEYPEASAQHRFTITGNSP